MPSAILQQPNIIKNGTCPHGAPLGACPICNGMGAGGMKKADHTAKPGEMSWNECAAIGAMLRAQKQAKLQKQQDVVSFANKIADFNNLVMRAVDKATNFTRNVSNNLPPIIAKPLNFIIKTFVINSLKFVNNLLINISNLVTNITQKIIDISDKISSVLGEIKTAISQKLNKFGDNIKKKFKSLFSIFDISDTDNEDKKVEESKKVFRLKTFIAKIFNKKHNTDIEQIGSEK